MKAQLVDSDNKIQPPEPMRDLLARIDRSVEHIRKVSDGPEEGIPVVKVVTRESLVAMVRSKEVVAKRKDVAELAKQVELNWAVSENDLGYRLKKITEFLSEGKRVEVMIAPKKRGRRASPEEMENVMERIKETGEAVEGAKIWKDMTGTPGKIVELYYMGRDEGQAALKERAVEEKEVKFQKKEAEKIEKKQKQEARMERRREELRKQEEEKRRLGIPIALCVSGTFVAYLYNIGCVWADELSSQLDLLNRRQVTTDHFKTSSQITAVFLQDPVQCCPLNDDPSLFQQILYINILDLE